MSNNLLCTDKCGKKDACVNGIFLLGVWDGRVFSKRSGTENFLKHEVHEESTYRVNEFETSKHGKDITKIAVDDKYKDTVFRMIFKEKREALSLYNALNDTKYMDYDDLKIVTLENAIYMNVKNDLAFLLDSTLNMYEHQSTYAPNMPLRNLIYVTSEYQKLVDKHSLFSERPIKIPTPRFVVFYNGKEKRPEREILKLSDLYESPISEPELELKVLVLNINKGYNEELKKSCKTLQEYMAYVDKVRYYSDYKKLPLQEAVEHAINECLKEDILVEFLRKNRSQVVGISIFEYDEELLKKDQFEYGLERGEERGIRFTLIGLVQDGLLTVHEAAKRAKMSLEEFEKLLE